MNKLQIYIGGKLIDLSKNTLVSFTYQSAVLGDIRSRQVSHTNNFKVPKSPINKRVYDFAHVVTANSLAPYRRQTALVLLNGLVMLQGVSFLQEASDNYSISIFEDVIDFYDAIKDLSLNDLDFGDSPITWDAAYIDSRRAAVSGLVAPAINYGQINSALVNAEIGDFYPPSIYYKDVLEEIFSDAGYTITFPANVLTKLDKMIIAYSRSDWQGDTFTMNDILPEMSQTDFVKHYLMHFGQVLTYEGSAITSLGFEEILTNKVDAIDWTLKRAKTDNEKITFGVEYAQNNYFRYFDDTFNQYRGNLVVDNTNLNASMNIYESIFGITDSESGLQSNEFRANDNNDLVYGATVNIWDSPATAISYEFDEEPRPIVLLIRDKIAAEPAILYDGNSRSDYKVGYWLNRAADQTGLTDESMRWRGVAPETTAFLDVHYPAFESSLNRAKTIDRSYYLTMLDIATLDLTKLIFDENVYYYINKIPSFVPGRITKVQLFKVAV